MTEKVLFVDDEPLVLEGIRRQLGRKVELEIAASGAEGLKLVQESGPYAVVISDMRMPNMNGSQFLAAVRAASPDSVRMILSGQSDIEATIAAVNDGQIFRFLVKPCQADVLWSVVEAGLQQYRLVHAERDVLEKTLGGAVKLLTEVLGLTNPAAYSQASRIQRYARAMAEALNITARWQIDMAAMLSQLGCITLPDAVLTKVYAGVSLSEEEQSLYDAHPDVAARLIGIIPRLESVSEIVAGQRQRPDLSGMPDALDKWDSKHLGSLVLRAAIELEQLVGQGLQPTVALQRLIESWPKLPATVANALRAAKLPAVDTVVRAIGLAKLAPGMVLDEDLISNSGIRLIPKGQEVTATLLVRLRSIAAGVGLREPFRVRVHT